MGCSNHLLKTAASVYNVNTSTVYINFRGYMSLLWLSDTLPLVAAAPENLLGCRGGLLHGGADRHLHVPVQKCVWALQTDNGHVWGRVSVCKSTLCCYGGAIRQKWDILHTGIPALHIVTCVLSALETWVWNGTTRWSCLHGFCFLLPSCWPVSSSCTTSTQISCPSLTLTMYLWDRLQGETAQTWSLLWSLPSSRWPNRSSDFNL